MTDDGRLLALLATLGVAGVAAWRKGGSRGIARSSRSRDPMFLGATGIFRPNDDSHPLPEVATLAGQRVQIVVWHGVHSEGPCADIRAHPPNREPRTAAWPEELTLDDPDLERELRRLQSEAWND